MAKVRINLVAADVQAPTMEALPVRRSQPRAGQSKTSSGASQLFDTLVGKPGEIWDIKVTGGDVWVSFGAAPVAAADVGDLVSAGERFQVAVSATGEKVAVIDA